MKAVKLNSFIYNVSILKKVFKSGFYKTFLVFLALLSFILFDLFDSPVPITIYSLRFALGLLFTNFLAIIWFLYQIGVTIYFSYLYFFYEVDNSLEFILLRTDFFHFVLKKFIFLEMLLIVFRILFYCFLHFLFFKNVTFTVLFFMINIGVHVFVSTITFLVFIIFHSRF